MSVRLVLINQSGCPIRIVSWPCREKDSADSPISVRSYSFAYWEDGSVPENGRVIEDQEVQLGSLRACHKIQLHEHYGWVFFDLLKQDGQALHLQAFLHLTHSGIKDVKLGRFDIDSSSSHPMPSGEVGSVPSFKPDDQEVRVLIDQSVATLVNEVDDSTHKGHKLQPGKVVETSTYVSNQLSIVSLIVGREGRYHEGGGVRTREPSDIRVSTHHVEGGTGGRIIGFWSQHEGKPFYEAQLKIAPLGGGISGSPFNSTRETVAVFSEDGSRQLNYGFSGQGISHHDQVYAYLTPSYANWLGDLIEEDPSWRDTPFSTLALAAAHDSGMFAPLDPGLAALITSGKLGDLIKSHVEANIESSVVHGLIVILEKFKLSPERVLLNIANTQKDTFATQLRLGVRFFDFRPGFCFADVINAKKGDIHHQHAIVVRSVEVPDPRAAIKEPGCAYADFLTDIFTFLEEHPKEIVFFEIKSDGFVLKKDTVRDGKTVALSMVPSVEELQQVLDNAKSKTGSSVVVGGPSDLDSKIGELIEANKRLLIVDKVHEPDVWPRDDSYDHQAYNTEDPATIIAALEKTYAKSSHPDEDAKGLPSRGCIYQFQATPTSSIGADLLGSITFSDCSSLLVWMKARMERQTYPWIKSKTFREPGNVLLLNDFVDGQLCELAIAKSIERKKARH